MSRTPMKEIKDMTVCVVGLPLAEAFARHLKVIGYRRNQEAVDALNGTMQQIIPSAMCTGTAREVARWNGFAERFDMTPSFWENYKRYMKRQNHRNS